MLEKGGYIGLIVEPEQQAGAGDGRSLALLMMAHWVPLKVPLKLGQVLSKRGFPCHLQMLLAKTVEQVMMLSPMFMI